MGKKKLSGITPTIVVTSPFTRTVCPITSGSPPKWFCHTVYPRITTCGEPGWSSPSTNSRPMSGGTRSMSSPPAIMNAPENRSGRPSSPLTFTVPL